MKCYQSGVCCKLFLINIDEEEYHSKEFETVFDEHFEDYNEALEKGAVFLKQKEDGSCIYLKDNLCSIHSKRPKVCREFYCDSEEEKYSQMVKEVKAYKKKFNIIHD